MKRRAFITGISAFIAAPAIIRVADLMPIKVWRPTIVMGLDMGGPHGDYAAIGVIDDNGLYRSDLTQAAINDLMNAITQNMRETVRPLAAIRQFRTVT